MDARELRSDRALHRASSVFYGALTSWPDLSKMRTRLRSQPLSEENVPQC